MVMMVEARSKLLTHWLKLTYLLGMTDLLMRAFFLMCAFTHTCVPEILSSNVDLNEWVYSPFDYIT